MREGLVTVHPGSTFVVINTINVRQRHLGRVIRTVQDAVNTVSHDMSYL